ncbi:MAG: isoprenyl transferase [Bacilli bacterium]|nr:isoprenyl transferase [Bacilli bacterium]MBN2697152.1 isoprenyl transferase [Bacilli bacterium]
MFKRKQAEIITIPKHIAIILDGNGRWAKRRGLPRTAGHQAGVENIKRIAVHAAKIGVKALSLYAFSTENWNRPKNEVDFLMNLPEEFETRFRDEFEKHDIKVMFSGRKTKISRKNQEILERITERSKLRQGLVLNICFDYGSKEEIVQAIKQIAMNVKEEKTTIEAIDEHMVDDLLYTKELPQLDLLIRPSGEIRLSNFLLWQVAYAELYFCETFWPAFSERELDKAIAEYSRRERRFGGLKG